MEPNPELYAKTKSRERNAWTLPSCFSTKKRPEIVKFDAAGAIGKYKQSFCILLSTKYKVLKMMYNLYHFRRYHQ